MSDKHSESGSDRSSESDSEVEISPEQRRQQEIRQKKLDALVKAREAARKSLALKSELKRNEKDIKERERLLKLTEQRNIKKKQTQELESIQKQQKKIDKMKASKPAKVYKEKPLEKEPVPSSSSSESESDTESESEDEKVVIKKVAKRRARRDRDKMLRQHLSEEVEREKWRILGDTISGRI